MPEPIPPASCSDALGNLYVANSGTSTISKITPAGVVSTYATLAANSQPSAIVFSGSNLYVSEFNAGNIVQISSTGTQTTFASGLSNPVGLAFDKSGNLYVAAYTANVVDKITSGGTVSAFSSALSGPTGLVFDASGSLYVGNNTNNTIGKIPGTGGTATTYALSPMARGWPSTVRTTSMRRRSRSRTAHPARSARSAPAEPSSVFASGFSNPRRIVFSSTAPEPGSAVLILAAITPLFLAAGRARSQRRSRTLPAT